MLLKKMSKFDLKHIDRTMFVVIGGKLYFSLPNSHISHGEWFRNEGWMKQGDRSFMEKNPRGYIGSEGVYIYQGYDARIPDLTKNGIKKLVVELKENLNIGDDHHVFLGVAGFVADKNGKLPSKIDLGKICDFWK
ncbi:MAG: hypothetical protein V1928_00960 [Parcubacteria group bacterium]